MEYYCALVAGDMLGVFLSLLLAIILRACLDDFTSFFPPFSLETGISNLKTSWWTFSLVILALAYRHTYDRRLPFWEEVRELMVGLLLGFILVFAFVSIGKISYGVSRVLIGLTYLFSVFVIPTERYIVKILLFRLPMFRRKAIILGAGEVGEELVRGLDREDYLGYEVIGFLDDDPKKRHKKIAGRKVYGPIKQVSKFVRFLGVDSVFIAMPSFSTRRLSEIFAHLQGLVREVSVVPEFRDIGMLNAELSCLFSQKLLLIKVQNNLKSHSNQIIKRSFDLLASLIFLPLLFPLLAIIAVLIIMDSPGNPVFVQERLGRAGKRFRIYKFRTMYRDSDSILRRYLKDHPEARREWFEFRKLRNYDPRITRIGRFLRKTSLDELPQILNVIKGDMSLVGPRPVTREEITEYYRDLSSFYFLVRPGITGLWQVSGRNNLSYDDRVKLDVWYVLNWSLWLDITLLIRTVRAVFNGEGSC